MQCNIAWMNLRRGIPFAYCTIVIQNFFRSFRNNSFFLLKLRPPHIDYLSLRPQIQFWSPFPSPLFSPYKNMMLVFYIGNIIPMLIRSHKFRSNFKILFIAYKVVHCPFSLLPRFLRCSNHACHAIILLPS